MEVTRPALVLATSILVGAGCGAQEPIPGGTGGSPGTAGNASGGSAVAGNPAGGNPPTGGSSPMAGTAGTNPIAGSSTGGGGSGNTAGSGGSGGGPSGGSGSGGGSNNAEGPCDIYGKAGQPCVAAYSTIRRLLSTYAGPLYQVRTGSNAMNTGTGGQTVDIGQTAAGFADFAAQNTACANTLCTVSKLYDQSGKGNDITVAKAGLPNGGEFADDDDFETTIGRADGNDKIKVGGHDVYSLYMEARQGYRQTIVGNDMPVDDEPQGIYMLADGTRTGTACCWDFGSVSPNPKTYNVMNTLFFGVGFWGKGAGTGPWFGADIEAGVWMGGSNPGEPGWGDLETADEAPANTNNPALRVKYALGFVKTTPDQGERYALRMADLATATAVTTAYAGAYPAGRNLDSQGAVVLGVGGDNSNNSWSTFYEGAIVAGFPEDATEDAIMQNLKALGYGQ